MASDTHVTPEMAGLIYKVSATPLEKRMGPNGKMYEVHPERRHIRNKLFHIQTGTEDVPGLQKWMELQFKPGWAWKDFTFEWDVSPREPLKVVSIHEWVAEGGVLEYYTERLENGIPSQRTRCTPTAFTRQER
jgi:hypothetical protein